MTYRTATNTRSVALSSCIVSALLLPACGGASGDSSPVQGERVEFAATDGISLTGRVFGEGSVGVVLAHMGRPGDMQADFYPLARALAERGYLALTYNRRGVCGPSGRECSQGFDDYASSWKDVVGAAELVRSKGTRTVVLIGASIGAMASLRAAASHRLEPAAFVEIGGVNHASGYDFSREELRELDGTKLFVSSADDRYGAAADAREWHSWAREPKRLEILPGSAHGTDMFISTEPTARTLTRLVLSFLMRAVPPDREEDE